jgi:hypothetical protein
MAPPLRLLTRPSRLLPLPSPTELLFFAVQVPELANAPFANGQRAPIYKFKGMRLCVVRALCRDVVIPLFALNNRQFGSCVLPGH